MANSKISALTSASTPLAGTEVLPIVQSSATVKVSVANLTPGLNTITAAKGGTGQTSYAVGDLLYANTTTTLAKLADVATGNALISGGVGVAPSWGQIGLTTHVSGTLPTANGGTNLTSFAANGVMYASSTSALATSGSFQYSSGNLVLVNGNYLLQSSTTSGNTSVGSFFGYSDIYGSNYNVAKIDFTTGSFADAGFILFSTKTGAGALTERARFDSSGNLLVGTTSSTTSPARGCQLSGSGNGQISIGHDTGALSGYYYASFAYNGGVIGSITQSGTTAVLYNVTSDQRLKENIVDAPEFGSVIDSIQVRSYDWKSDRTHQRAGFIAQELVTVAPEAVHQPADPDEMMAVDYSKIVPMLVKEIQDLRKRLTAVGI
jgi:hypothetical protein